MKVTSARATSLAFELERLRVTSATASAADCDGRYTPCTIPEISRASIAYTRRCIDLRVAPIASDTAIGRLDRVALAFEHLGEADDRSRVVRR